jgi:type I restriction enzyme M protein
MAIKKSELYSSLWKSCDELRGGMDASQYKDYVLVLLFMKYVSDKFSSQNDALIEVPKGDEPGKGGSFQDMVFWKNQKEIGDEINKIIGRLAEANDLKGVIDVADFNDEDKLGKGKEMVDRLTNLITIFQNPSLDFSKNRADGDDILGDAYEYLMRHFATESGKSKGQFYTPAEVSRIMAKVIGIKAAKSQDQTIYDPTCGSGSLLLKAADETEHGVTIYGQEKDVATAALARMNMILHNNPTAEIKKGQSTLSDPLFLNPDGSLKTFDFVVANPPFSSKNWSNGFIPSSDVYNRFKGFGIPPSKNGDYAFLLHIVRSLKSKGKGAIILPHGVLFRGNAEAQIRENLIRKGYIKGIIGLPANLFYGTGIPACIIILDKENAEGRKGIFMIDASKGFIKDGNKNRLREQDIHKIVDVFNKGLEVTKYARMVPVAEIEENKYNLNIPRYIDSQELEDIQDIEAHISGGIPKSDIDALQNYWHVYPSLKEELFEDTDRKNYCQLKVGPKHIRITIFSHPEFIKYATEMNNVFLLWQSEHEDRLKGIAIGDKPKLLIHELAESLLTTFADKKLIDAYDIYQHLLNYWFAVMQDDVYMLVIEGWQAGNEVEYVKKDWDGKLIPKVLLTEVYFPKEKKQIEELEAARDTITHELISIEAEHNTEDGLLADAQNEKGKVTKATVQKRLKELQKAAKEQPLNMAAEPAAVYGEETEEDELTILNKYLALLEKEAAADKEVREAQAKLEKLLLAKYKAVSIDEIKTVVVTKKWMGWLNKDVQNEMDRISQRLANRVKQLAERYEYTLPEVAMEVHKLEEKVNEHLQAMGFDVSSLSSLTDLSLLEN